MIILKEEFSDESFESTEESDATVDLTGEDGITHKNFQNTEVVWAKRPALPWFPGIVKRLNSFLIFFISIIFQIHLNEVNRPKQNNKRNQGANETNRSYHATK